MRTLALAVMMAVTGIARAGGAAPADIVAINVLIEPDDAMAAQARALNTLLRAAYPQGFALDADHAPHITVLQRYVRRADLQKMFAAVGPVIGRNDLTGRQLRATGLYAAPFAGMSMVSIQVEPKPELLMLQDELIAALGAFVVAAGDAAAFAPGPDGQPVNQATVDYVRQFVPAASGTRYNPHLTIGVGRAADAAGLVAEPFSATSFRIRSISIYQLGDFGTARRRLWTASSESREKTQAP